jgi:hypothetical protein
MINASEDLQWTIEKKMSHLFHEHKVVLVRRIDLIDFD